MTTPTISKLYETHMHTPLCKHARGWPEEYAEVAIARGLSGIIVTCHNPMPDGFSPSVRMSPSEFPEYLSIVEQARESMAERTEVRLGLECDYFPGYESHVEKQTASAPLEYVLGSVHPQLGNYQAEFGGQSVFDFQRTYFTHLADAAETGLFDCISHPDLVKNCNPDDWDLDRIFDHILGCLDRIAGTDVAMELNTSGLHKRIQEFNPNARMLAAMCERRIPVVIGADAHDPRRVGADFETALEFIRAAGYERVSVFLDRKRHEIEIDTALSRLKPLEESPD
ncbi:MAG: histidinol-phosphatase [Planctomycetota bacterium]